MGSSQDVNGRLLFFEDTEVAELTKLALRAQIHVSSNPDIRALLAPVVFILSLNIA